MVRIEFSAEQNDATLVVTGTVPEIADILNYLWERKEEEDATDSIDGN